MSDRVLGSKSVQVSFHINTGHAVLCENGKVEITDCESLTVDELKFIIREAEVWNDFREQRIIYYEHQHDDMTTSKLNTRLHCAGSDTWLVMKKDTFSKVYSILNHIHPTSLSAEKCRELLHILDTCVYVQGDV